MRRFAFAALVAPLLAAGCAPGDDADAGPPPDCAALSTTLEVRAPDTSWRPVSESPPADLILGFQGFKMLYVRVRASAPPPPGGGAIVIQVDGDPPASQSFAKLAAGDDGQGGVVSDPFPLFFNDDPLPYLAGRRCALTLRLGTQGCGAISAGQVTMIYHSGCVQNADGGLSCSDGGT